MKSKPPFPFILEQLLNLDPVVKPMFGCHAVYVGKKIMLILRNRADHPLDNGVWIATSEKHHAGLKALFPSMRSIDLLGKGKTNWQVLPMDADDFEESANQVCDLLLKGDERIGTIPKPKSKTPKKNQGK
ncbi:MAG TPA: hypothetical protein VNZ86_13125 [Bacteroidia bacterium]|jgi:hypothetical protein|nr:hypothetical protein [Bacteroidia bacterium]